ncbi:MAG: hypothetical protein ACLQNE_27805 [Thermoguttaceae bacterium]
MTLILVPAALAARRWWPGRAGADYARLLQEPADGAGVDAEMESRIKSFCGDCHSVPLPESFSRDLWHDEVIKVSTFPWWTSTATAARISSRW